MISNYIESGIELDAQQSSKRAKASVVFHNGLINPSRKVLHAQRRRSPQFVKQREWERQECEEAIKVYAELALTLYTRPLELKIKDILPVVRYLSIRGVYVSDELFARASQ